MSLKICSVIRSSKSVANSLFVISFCFQNILTYTGFLILFTIKLNSYANQNGG